MTRRLTELRGKFLIAQENMKAGEINPKKAVAEGRIASKDGKPIHDKNGDYIPIDTRPMDGGVPNPHFMKPLGTPVEISIAMASHAKDVVGESMFHLTGYAGFLEEYIEKNGTGTIKMEDYLRYIDSIFVVEDFDVEGINSGNRRAVIRGIALMRKVVEIHQKLFDDCHVISIDGSGTMTVTVPEMNKP